LARMIGAFISRRDARELIYSKLNVILGIFQKLINSKANDQHAFFLLNCMVHYLELPQLEKYFPNIMRAIFSRVRAKKTNKLIRGLLLFLSTMILNTSIDDTIKFVESVQPGMFHMVINKLILPDLVSSTAAGTLREKRAICIALALLLTKESSFLQQENNLTIWSTLLSEILKIFDLHKIRDEDVEEAEDLPDDITVAEGSAGMDESEKLTLTKSYQAAFTALAFAGSPSFDPLPSSGVNGVTKKSHHFVLASGLKGMNESRLGMLCQNMDNESKGMLSKFLAEGAP